MFILGVMVGLVIMGFACLLLAAGIVHDFETVPKK